MISAVLIVKNESQMLERALSSVSEFDEIVVCDTGSADNTVDIAESFGAKVVHFDWCDDFSAARNFAKSVAKHEWILSIDADEFLEPNGIKKLNLFELVSNY
jgi:glycosyltransferase involved in cell wall biosynthesis